MLACINKKCVDPCLGSCGKQAICKVVNHIAMCICIEKYTGDPFTECIHEESKIHINFSDK